MNETINSANTDFGFSPNATPQTPNVVPGWQKCLSCSDYGVSCNGPSLGSLGNIDSVRSFHKALKKARKLSLKVIADAAPTISDSTINEYFSNVIKDYKWTTVSAIDNALACICGNRVGAMPLDNTCPASSSEIRNQLAAAELKVAAAELKAAQGESDAAGLMQKLAANKEKHIAQIALLESAHAKDMEWMKNEVRLWRRFAFVLLITGLILLACTVFYIGWDAAHPASGLIRY
jgi:hypothetical protein